MKLIELNFIEETNEYYMFAIVVENKNIVEHNCARLKKFSKSIFL